MKPASPQLEHAEEALREQVRAFRALQRIAVAVNQAPSVDEAVRLCLDELCEHGGFAVGHALAPAEDAPPRLESTGLWRLHSTHRTANDAEAFQRATEHLGFEAGVGLPGRVLRSRQPERWAAGDDEGPEARRVAEAEALSLRTGFAVPVLQGSEVAYVLELYSRRDMDFDPLLLEVFGWAGTQLAWLIKRHLKLAHLEAERAAAEAAQCARAELLDSLIDELAGPLGGVAEAARELARRAESEGREADLPELSKIQSTCQQLLASLRQAVRLPELEQGTAALELSTFDVRQMIGELVGSVLPLAERTRNTVEVSCSGALGVMHSDLAKLRLCLFNLLANACRLTERGTITLGISRQRRGGGEFLVYTVSDTGSGLASEDAARILAAATRGDTATMHRNGGIGLGLALSKISARLLHGELTAVNEPGRGPTFVVWFPADVEAWYADPTQRTGGEVRWSPRRGLTTREAVFEPSEAGGP